MITDSSLPISDSLEIGPDVHASRVSNLKQDLRRFATTYKQEFDQAAIDIELEQHQDSSFMDVVKALFMWVETPEERMRKNHFEQVSKD